MIKIGTSGFTFRDWIGAFYPTGLPRGRMLEYYARHFDLVEINASYYRIPTRSTFKRMADVTPENFGFVVKTFKGMTHDRNCDDATYAQFHQSVQPLRDAKKLIGFLAQFPWSFKFSHQNLNYIQRLKENFAGDSLHIEFRNDTWLRDDVFNKLENSDIGFCMVDEPPLDGLLPPVTKTTTDIGYVRFHGRNTVDWWHPRKGSDRYNYDYSDDELAEWMPKINELLKRCKFILIFFNNCHFGRAPKNAERMMELLDIKKPFLSSSQGELPL
ncbi:MAG: DUF72 domain-containing protein [bacterium]